MSNKILTCKSNYIKSKIELVGLPQAVLPPFKNPTMFLPSNSLQSIHPQQRNHTKVSPPMIESFKIESPQPSTQVSLHHAIKCSCVRRDHPAYMCGPCLTSNGFHCLQKTRNKETQEYRKTILSETK